MDDADSARHANHVSAAKQYIEEHYKRLHAMRAARTERRKQLMDALHESGVSEDERTALIEEHNAKESATMRVYRKKLTLADYNLIQCIGRGAFGEVHLAKEIESGRICALKILRKTDMLQRSQIAHVRAERDVLAKSTGGGGSHSSCPWITQLYSSFQDACQLYLVMEYLPGGDLMSLLMKRETLDDDTVKRVLAEVIVAVDAVHQLGYLHRDLKPDNVLFTAEGHVKLTDFGLASPGVVVDPFTGMYERQSGKEADPVDSGLSQRQHIQSWRTKRRLRAFSAVGTPDYVSPEVLQRLPEGYGMEADWWSVGVILYECLVGYAPFYADTARDTCTKIVRWREYLHFPTDAGISPDARSLICAFLCDAPHRLGRGGLAEVQAHPFFKGVDWDELLSATPPFVPELTNEMDTRHFDVFDEPSEMETEAAAAMTSPDRWKKTHKDMPFVGYTFKRSEANDVVEKLSPRGRPKTRGLAGMFNEQ